MCSCPERYRTDEVRSTECGEMTISYHPPMKCHTDECERLTMACKLLEELLMARHSLTKTYEEIRVEMKAENFLATVKE